MCAKKTILIIGAGQRGSEIAGKLLRANVNLLFCDKDHARATALAQQAKNKESRCEAEAMACYFQSAWEADIIILAMNFRSQKEVGAIIKEVVNQKILVSVMDAREQINAESCPEARRDELLKLFPNTNILIMKPDDKLVSANRIPVDPVCWLPGFEGNNSN